MLEEERDLLREHKKKVLIVHNYYQIPGGEDTVVTNEKKLLEDHGHDVMLYTRHNNELKTMNKLQKLALVYTTIFNLRTYREVIRIIKEQDIEIVHVHNTLNLISPSVYYAAVKCCVPVVQTIHNFRLLCPGATFYRKGHVCEDCVTKGLRCAIKHKCYRGNYAQTLVCVINTWIHRHTGILGKINYIVLTGFNKEKLLQLKQINAGKVFVKPNFTFEHSENQGGTLRRYYLFIGRIEEIKGIRLLVEAFSGMPCRELRIAGQGLLRGELEKQCTKNITFLGQVGHDELIDLIAGAKAVILPSQVYEGFPMIIPEAFSMHIPMIVGDMGNSGVLVEEGLNGMKFKYNSMESLIEVIERFENADIVSLGEKAYKTYQERYSSESNYANLREIYNKVVREGLFIKN